MRFFFFSLCFLSFLFPLQAQVSGCDGSRYKNDVFANVKKTTLLYAPTKTILEEDIQLSMDVYEPEGDAAAKRPLVVVAHGGSFYLGDRTQMAQYCQLLAKKGYVAATIQYRLFPLFTLGFPDSADIFDTAVKAMGDMKAAVRYFRLDAATDNRFRIDPAHIFAGGYSAGAVTALNTGYIDTKDTLPTFIAQLVAKNGGIEGSSGSPENKLRSSAVEAVLNMSGGMYRRNWVDKDDVPLVSVHGTLDMTVPYTKGLSANIAYLEGSSLLHERADAIGLRNSLTTVQGAGHTDLYASPLFATQLANYWVKATDLMESLACVSTGTTDFQLHETDWRFAPNPLGNDRRLTLDLPENVLAPVDFSLCDVSGRTVFQAQRLISGQSVQLPALPSGTYFARLTNAQSLRFAMKPVQMP